MAKRNTRLARESAESRFQELLTLGFLALLLSIFILYCGTGGYETITEYKWRMLLFLSGGYLILLGFLCFELLIVGGKPTARSPLSLAEKLLLGYWLASAISTFCAVDRMLAFWGGPRREGFITISLYCAICLLISRFGKPRSWLLFVFSAAMLLNCILCSVQLAGLNPFSLYPADMSYYDANKLYAGEFLGTIGNVDILSAVLCLAIPAFFAAAVLLHGKRRVYFLLSGMICFGVLLGAKVVGGFVGLFGCALLSAPVLLHDRRAKRRAVCAATGICVLGVIAVYAFGNRMGSVFLEASELLHGRWNDDYGSGRLYIWRSVFPLIPERLLFGGGPDTLSVRLGAAFERWDSSLGILIHSSIDTAHNEYLNILVNEGLLALLCYLGMLGVLAVKWVRRASTDPVCAISGCAVLGYCIQAFFGIRSPVSAPLFFISIAYLIRSGENLMIDEEKVK